MSVGEAEAPRIVARTTDDLVVWKPAGMPSELTDDTHGRSLLTWLRAREPGARLVHRLDRDTRGLLLVATTREAAAAHARSLQARAWTKLYVARVRAHAGLLGRHKAFLKERTHVTEVVRSGGRPAFLEVLGTWPAPARPGEVHVLVRLDTGRRHQIRVMLAAVGAPLVGDTRYGGPPGPYGLEAVLLAFPGLDGARRVYTLADAPEREPWDAGLAAAVAAVG